MIVTALWNRVAAVTGASSGIGRAIALALASQQMEVCLIARREKELNAVAEEVSRKGGKALVLRADLTSDEDISGVGACIERRFGRLDVLALCSGVMVQGGFVGASVADFDSQYQANVRAHYALTQRMLPLLRAVMGQIVFINSSVGLRSSGAAGQYSATKHALRALADGLREEVNADGIRVLSVYPGRTATPRMAALFEQEGRPYRPELLMQPEDVAETVAHALSLPRTAEVTDISMRPMWKSY